MNPSNYLNGINPKYIFSLPSLSAEETTYVIPTQISWLRELISSKRVPAHFPRHDKLTDDEVFAFLSQGKCDALGAKWIFIHLTILQTSSIRNKYKELHLSTESKTTNTANILDFIGKSNYELVFESPYISLLPDNETDVKNCENFIECEEREYASKLFQFLFPKEEESGDTNERILVSNLAECLTCIPFICESMTTFLIFRPFVPHTLLDLTSFSPKKLSSNSRQLFILYQILKFLNDMELRGIHPGSLRLIDFTVDEGLYVSAYPSFTQILKGLLIPCKEKRKEDERISFLLNGIREKVRGRGVPITIDVAETELIIRHWVEGFISNYDYILFLNFLVGRFSEGNPNYQPVFPWVTDFSQNGGGWRDLSKSKFRINKGERQLDMTFEDSSIRNVPHHITDILSEITFYVYKARRTPKEVLCKFVRPKWVPAEYPVSIQRMQEWTPDECIPEFYDDESIFKSIHEDLPDLQTPSFTKDPTEFIKYHRETLESDLISSRLHHWIDIVFGYKLSGNAAVKAKNVYLCQVDGHTKLEKNGIVQVFQTPHPPKKSALRNKKNIVTYEELKELRETEKYEIDSANQHLTLPKHYEPLGFLNDFEVCFNFFRTHFPQCRDTDDGGVKLKGLKAKNDMSTQVKLFSCLLLELIQGSKSRHISSISTLEERFLFHSRNLNFSELPLYAKRLLQVTFTPEKLEFSIPIEMSLSFLLGGGKLSPLPFPSSFEQIYKIVKTLRGLDLVIESMSVEDDESRMSQSHLQELKVKSFSRDLIQILTGAGDLLDEECLDVILPFVLELFTHPATRVLAVWNLFCPLGRALGRDRTKQYFLHPLIQIYESDYNSDKHLKLFHRSFFLQLMSCFGLETFLDNFATLIIEATAAWPKNLSEQNENKRTHLKSSEMLEAAIPTMRPSSKTKQLLTLQKSETEGDMPTAEPEMFLMEADCSDNESTSSQSTGSQAFEPVEEEDRREETRIRATCHDISEMCCESLVWLAHRLGPVLTAKYLTRNLLRMLTICYGEDLGLCQRKGRLSCEGDTCANGVFDALLVISDLYGDPFVERQYVPYCIDVISSSLVKMNTTLEAALLGAASLLDRLFRHMSDTLLVALLKDPLIKRVLTPLINIVCSPHFIFPSGSDPRALLASKCVGMLKSIKKKLGPDLTILMLKPLVDQICFVFEEVNSGSIESKDIRTVFDFQLAHQVYSTFCDLITGSKHEEILRDFYLRHGVDNISIIKEANLSYEKNRGDAPVFERQQSSFGSRSFGNRIQITEPETSPEKLPKSTDKTRHLKGNWLLYWEHEVGRSESQFNFKQIKLQTFTGHTGAVRAIHFLNNENSFLSASKDKTVKIYSLRNQGDENTVTTSNWTYSHHKKPLFSVIFHEPLHLAASTDGSIHIWDPFVGKIIRILDRSSKAICSLKLVNNSSHFVGASMDNLIHVVDVRSSKTFEMKIGIGQNNGLVRCMTVSNNGNIVSVGNSSGMLSALDLRNGSLLGSLKAHEGEIWKLISYKDKYVISSSYDNVISLWNMDENKHMFQLGGPTEPVHSLSLFNTNLISCTTSNRIGVHVGIEVNSGFSSTRLRSDSIKGIVTTMSLLPLNQLLLLGSDSGNISLLC